MAIYRRNWQPREDFVDLSRPTKPPVVYQLGDTPIRHCGPGERGRSFAHEEAQKKILFGTRSIGDQPRKGTQAAQIIALLKRTRRMMTSAEINRALDWPTSKGNAAQVHYQYPGLVGRMKKSPRKSFYFYRENESSMPEGIKE